MQNESKNLNELIAPLKAVSAYRVLLTKRICEVAELLRNDEMIKPLLDKIKKNQKILNDLQEDLTSEYGLDTNILNTVFDIAPQFCDYTLPLNVVTNLTEESQLASNRMPNSLMIALSRAAKVGSQAQSELINATKELSDKVMDVITKYNLMSLKLTFPTLKSRFDILNKQIDHILNQILLCREMLDM